MHAPAHADTGTPGRAPARVGLPNGLHHLAIATRDVKTQIEFFTDVIGLELVALYWMHGVADTVHAFLRLSDTASLALVQGPEMQSIEPQLGVSHAGFTAGPVAPGAVQHVALNVDTEDELLAMRDRIRSRGHFVMGPIDHGMCKSIYFAGPEGLQLELATGSGIDPAHWIDPEVVAFCAIEAADLRRYRARLRSSRRAVPFRNRTRAPSRRSSSPTRCGRRRRPVRGERRGDRGRARPPGAPGAGARGNGRRPWHTYAVTPDLTAYPQEAIQMTTNARIVRFLTTLTLLTGSAAAHAGGVVGNGSPGSCTPAALTQALAGGGTVTFACGPDTQTIVLPQRLTIAADTTIAGEDRIILSGGGAHGHFTVDAGRTLTLDRVTVRDGGAELGRMGRRQRDAPVGGRHRPGLRARRHLQRRRHGRGQRFDLRRHRRRQLPRHQRPLA